MVNDEGMTADVHTSGDQLEPNVSFSISLIIVSSVLEVDVISLLISFRYGFQSMDYVAHCRVFTFRGQFLVGSVVVVAPGRSRTSDFQEWPLLLKCFETDCS